LELSPFSSPFSSIFAEGKALCSRFRNMASQEGEVPNNPPEGDQPVDLDDAQGVDLDEVEGEPSAPVPKNDPPPKLINAFEALELSSEERIDICGSKRFPPNVMEYIRSKLTEEWTPGELQAELSVQADALTAELLEEAERDNSKKQREKSAAEKDEDKRKRREEEDAARVKKEEDDEKKDKKAEDRDKKTEKREKKADDREKKADDRRKKEEQERRKEEEKKHKAAMQRQKEDEKARKEEEKKIKEEEKKKKEEEKKKKKEEEQKKKEEEKKLKEEEKKKQDEEQKKAKEEKDEERVAKKEEEKKKKEEEKKKAAAAKQQGETGEERERREKKEEEEREKEKEKAAKKEEDKKKKNEEKEKKSEEKAKKDEENKKKKAAAAANKSEDDKKKDEEKKKRDEETKEKKEEEKEKKAVKSENDKKQREEEKKKKEEDDRKKAAAKSSNNEEEKRKKEEQRRKKEEEDKRKAEEKKVRDEEEKEKKAKRDEEKKKKDEEQKKKDAAAAAKKKEQDDKRSEKEKERKDKEKQRKAAQKERDDKRNAADKKRREEQKKRDEESKRKEREEKRKKKDEKEEWDEETGHMVKKKEKKKHRQTSKKINHATYAEDVCCGNSGDHPAGACRACCCMLYWLVIPPLFAALCFLEYQQYGLHRVLARSAGEGYNVTDFTVPTPSPTEWDVKTKGQPPPFDAAKVAELFLHEHPFTLALPFLGLGFGIFANLCPMAPGLVLVPLFEELAITKTPQGAMELSMWLQFIGSGCLGFMSWCGRDARFFICRALFLLTPIHWLGYVVGVTNHLSFKDLLMDINEDIDDDAFRLEIEKKRDCDLEGGCSADINKLHTYIRIGFGCFMIFMSFWVLIGICIGGMNRYCCPSRTGGSTPGCKSFCQWLIIMCCCFNTGYIFEANIGCGAGLTTFFLLSVFLGVEHKRAMPTAIVAGGWAQIVPLYMNYYYRGHQDPFSIPYVRMMMMFPGLWFGSLLAPWMSRVGGPMCDLCVYFFVLLAVGTAVVCWGALQLQLDKEDVDINIKPMYAVPDIDTYFEMGEPTAAPVPMPKPASNKPRGGGGAKPGGKPPAKNPRELMSDVATEVGTRALEYFFDVDFSAGSSDYAE